MREGFLGDQHALFYLLKGTLPMDKCTSGRPASRCMFSCQVSSISFSEHYPTRTYIKILLARSLHNCEDTTTTTPLMPWVSIETHENRPWSEVYRPDLLSASSITRTHSIGQQTNRPCAPTMPAVMIHVCLPHELPPGTPIRHEASSGRSMCR